MQRRTERRLVLLERHQERVRIPGVAGGLRREIGDVSDAEFLRQRENVLRRCTSAVEQDGDDAGLVDRRTGLQNLRIGVRILAAHPGFDSSAVKDAGQTRKSSRAGKISDVPWISFFTG